MRLLSHPTIRQRQVSRADVMPRLYWRAIDLVKSEIQGPDAIKATSMTLKGALSRSLRAIQAWRSRCSQMFRSSAVEPQWSRSGVRYWIQTKIM